MEFSNLLPIIIQAGSFIAAFAAITAGIIMHSITKKFGTGILANGFKTISTGVIFIAAGIIIDAANHYIALLNPNIAMIILLIKDALFITGTYIIVIGSKKTGDKLESVTK